MENREVHNHHVSLWKFKQAIILQDQLKKICTEEIVTNQVV